MVTLSQKYGKIQYKEYWYPKDLERLSEHKAPAMLPNDCSVRVDRADTSFIITVDGPQTYAVQEISKTSAIEIIVADTGVYAQVLNIPKPLRERVRWALGFGKRDLVKYLPEAPYQLEDRGWYQLIRKDDRTMVRYRRYPTLEEALETLRDVGTPRASYIAGLVTGEYV